MIIIHHQLSFIINNNDNNTVIDNDNGNTNNHNNISHHPSSSTDASHSHLRTAVKDRDTPRVKRETNSEGKAPKIGEFPSSESGCLPPKWMVYNGKTY